MIWNRGYGLRVGLVPGTGFEPARGCPRQPLKLVRLPVPPPGQDILGLASEIIAIDSRKSRGATTLPNLAAVMQPHQRGGKRCHCLAKDVSQVADIDRTS